MEVINVLSTFLWGNSIPKGLRSDSFSSLSLFMGLTMIHRKCSNLCDRFSNLCSGVDFLLVSASTFFPSP